MPELRNIEHTEQQNCSISEYSSVIHNDLFVLHLVNVFYFAQLPGSKAQFQLYSAAELVSQAGEILYTELSPDPISTGLLCSGGGSWKQHISNGHLISPRQSHIIQFIAKKKNKNVNSTAAE